jgi:sugar fermentation stimulation protein A
MNIKQPLISGTFIKREKRFLADIILQDGKHITAHCPNSGSMKSCLQAGWEVRLSYHDSKKRKLAYTLEMVHNGQCWIGVNTLVPNRLAEEAIKAGKIKELTGYDEIRREQRYGKNSRIDLLLSKEDRICYVEIKNVTLLEADGKYYFPDSVTERGKKHLVELHSMVQCGHRAVSLFIVQRNDGNIFKPAEHIDPAYAYALREAHRQGVEILVYRAEVKPEKIELVESIPWQL